MKVTGNQPQNQLTKQPTSWPTIQPNLFPKLLDASCQAVAVHWVEASSTAARNSCRLQRGPVCSGTERPRYLSFTASPSWCGSITIRKTHHVMSAVTSNFQGIQQSTYQLPAKTKDPLKMILLRIIIAIHDNLIFLGTVSKIWSSKTR